MMLTLFCQILEVVVLFQLFLPELVLRHLTEIRCHFLKMGTTRNFLNKNGDYT